MSFDEFISKWAGQPVDFDGIYPNQCMDLMHQYAYDVLGVTDKAVLAAPAAYQAYRDWPNFDRIDNTPTGVPQKGDILFFGQAIGQYSHVCIFIEGDADNFKSFDANWPAGSLPHIQGHNYNGVLGWLRSKTQVPMSKLTQAQEDALRIRRDDLYNENQDLQKTIITLNGKIEQQALVIAQDARDDHDLGLKNLALESRLNDIIKELGLSPDSPQEVVLQEITALRRPHEETIKYTVKTLSEAWKNLQRQSTKKLTLAQKIKILFS